VLAPSAAPGPSSSTVPATAPVAFGRPVPDRLTAALAGAGSIDLDARSRTAVWWLASLVKERTDLAVAPQEPLLVARWNDGSRLEVVVSGGLLFTDGKIYLGPATVYEQLAAYSLAAPARLSELASRGATVRIADLPGVQRALTAAEIAELRASLSKGFSVSEGELPFMLEFPFPMYEIVLGDVVIRLHGDDYGSLGAGQRRIAAFVHDGTLDDLARRWLPAPALGVEAPRSLFPAGEGGSGGPAGCTWSTTAECRSPPLGCRAMPFVIFDMDGVLYRGAQVLPYAREALDRLRRASWDVFFATNNSTATRLDYLGRL